ncbi:MAG: potassium channel family protein [Mycobacteriales bacterium]
MDRYRVSVPLFLVHLARRLSRRQVAVLLLLAGTSIVVGAWLFSATQHLSFGTGLYWAVTTASTVGYGDVTPHNSVGRVVAVGEMLTAIPLFAGVFAVVTAAATSTQLRRLLGMDRSLPDQPYTLVFGNHSLIPLVVGELHERGAPVVLVRDPAAAPAEAPDGVHVISGDPASEAVIARSEPVRAREALLATTQDGDALIIAVILRKLAPQLPVMAVVSSPDVAAALHDLGVTRTVSVNELVGHVVAKSLEAPHASDLLLRMLGTDRYRLTEVDVEQRWQGQRLTAVRSQAKGFVLGAVVAGAVVLGVVEDPVLGAADRLLVLDS